VLTKRVKDMFIFEKELGWIYVWKVRFL
jgi:hypothetical protein